VARRDRREYESLLRQALAVDPDRRPEWRLANLVMQRRARWLLAHAEQQIPE
jgi:predicted anti-sigma-YlaC factor YlaD